MGGAQTLGDCVARMQRQTSAAGARDQWRYRDVQPIQQARFDEPRYRRAAAFDEHGRQRALVQTREQEGEPQAAGANSPAYRLLACLFLVSALALTPIVRGPNAFCLAVP